MPYIVKRVWVIGTVLLLIGAGCGPELEQELADERQIDGVSSGDGSGQGADQDLERDALVYPGAHSVVEIERLQQLVVWGVRSIETDVMYNHGKGEFYVQHPTWYDFGCKDSIKGGSPTLEAFLQALDRLRPLLSSGRPTFVYLDMKDLCLSDAAKAAEAKNHGIRDKFLGHLRALYAPDKGQEPLNVVWVSSGQRRWAKEARNDPVLGPHFLIDSHEPCAAPPDDDQHPEALACEHRLYSVDGKGDGPGAYLGTAAGRRQLYNPTLKRWAGAHDRFPIRFYFSDDTSRESVEGLVENVRLARASGAAYRAHSRREFYLCNNEDPAQQSLWLGTRELGRAPTSRQLSYNLRVRRRQGGESKGDEVAVGTEVVGSVQYIVEVHRSEGSGTKLWYSTYRRNLTTGRVDLLRGTTSYDTGRRPDIALVAHQGTIYGFEVHANEKSSTVWYNWFRLGRSTGELTRLAHDKLSGGKRPRVAIARSAEKAYAVVEHESASGGKLYLHLYRYDLGKGETSFVTLRSPYFFDTGAHPDVAAAWTGDGTLKVVEVHESGGSDKDLWTTSREINPDGSTRSVRSSKRYDRGERPSVAMAALRERGRTRAVLMETHADGDNLWYTLTTYGYFRAITARVGDRSGRRLIHGKYDTGRAPAVALAVTDKLTCGGEGDVVMAEAHRTEDDDLWMDAWWVSPASHHLLW